MGLYITVGYITDVTLTLNYLSVEGSIKIKKHKKLWGLYDTVDKLWMAHEDEEGPRAFDDEILARVSAEVVNRQLGYKDLRIKHKIIKGENWRKRDSVPVVKDSLTCIKEMEDGKLP